MEGKQVEEGGIAKLPGKERFWNQMGRRMLKNFPPWKTGQNGREYKGRRKNRKEGSDSGTYI